MKASILDLRYKMKNILKALERNERITILYHGKEKGVLIPSKIDSRKKVKDHPLFGIRKEETKSVDAEVEELRGKRYNAF